MRRPFYFSVLKFFTVPLVLCGIWQGIILINDTPYYILPSPLASLNALGLHWQYLLFHASITASEIILGLMIGLLLGIASAVIIMSSRTLHQFLTPFLVVTQALPVFALAPLLVLWLGYGLASKIAMAVLIIYFPIMAAFLDSMRRIDRSFLHMAYLMQAKKIYLLRFIYIPAGLPGLAAGMRIGAVSAPIGAVVGEWVGSSHGLGFVMLHANARLETPLMFAALLLLTVMAVLLYSGVGFLADKLVWWQKINTGYLSLPLPQNKHTL